MRAVGPGGAPEPAQALRAYAVALWLLLALFIGRVVGQALVAFFDVGFLPPMGAWQSGLMAYPWLLASQLVIVLVFGKICLDFSRGHGIAVVPRPRFGQGLLVVGGLYLLAMLARYAVRMALYDQERWTGGSIPTFFHWLLAGFVLVLGSYHWRRLSAEDRRARAGTILPVVALLAAAALAMLVGSRMAHLPPPGPSKPINPATAAACIASAGSAGCRSESGGRRGARGPS
jgi:hypothetical protein